MAGTSLPTRAKRPYNTDTLRDVVRGLQKQISLSKLISYDKHVRPYLAALLVGAVSSMGEKLVVPDSLQLERLSREAFEEHVSVLSNAAYEESGVLGPLMGITRPQQVPPAEETLYDVVKE